MNTELVVVMAFMAASLVAAGLAFMMFGVGYYLIKRARKL